MAKVAHVTKTAMGVGALKAHYLIGVHDDADTTLDKPRIAELIVYGDAKTAMDAAEETAFDAVTLGGILAITAYGAKSNV